MADHLLVVLRPVIEAARRALADLDGDQVPADLRRVVSATGGRLPPPLALSLLDALGRYGWLRERALEAWPEADRGAPGGLGAAAAFLERTDGWEVELARAVGAAAQSSADRATRDQAEESARARRELTELRARVRAEQGEHRAEVSRLKGERDRARAERNELAAADRRDREALRATAAAAEVEAGELTDRLTAAERERDRVRDELREVRRARAAAEHRAAEIEGRPSWFTGDPVEMAKRLDEVAAMFRPAAPPSWRSVADGAGGDLDLPKGVAPDSVAAVEWLVARTAPTTVLVDGYNVGFLLVPDRNPVAARRRLRLVLERLARVASGPLRIVVVYDGIHGVAADPPVGGPLEERFTAGESADDALVALAWGAWPVVVVSGDRAVREGVERAGGRGLWAEALVEWGSLRR